MLEFLQQPWPWYVAGPLIGLMVPMLLLLGNKSLGISSFFRHLVACSPLSSSATFFQYDWKKESWNLVFVAGIFLGAVIVYLFLQNPETITLNADLKEYFIQIGIDDFSGMLPQQLFSFQTLFTLRGFILIVVGGFLVGFGTRYAGGCTSGHTIMGLSNLQLPSLIASICFMLGGLIVANFVLPFILKL